jgi:hypothetical protein
MMFSATLFVGGAVLVIAYSLWAARRVSRLSVTEASGIGAAALIVLVVFLLLVFKSLH